ncbi:hypothetical protein AB5I41_17385 [Sphingomonas sp. MMS24-JH45]
MRDRERRQADRAPLGHAAAPRPRQGPIAGDLGISHGEIMFRRDAYCRAGGYRDAFRDRAGERPVPAAEPLGDSATSQRCCTAAT